MAETKLTDQQIISADNSTLSAENLSRKIQLIQAMKAEQELDVVRAQHEIYKKQKDQELILKVSRLEAIEAETNKKKVEQSTCPHKVGGQGMEGILNGDGGPYGDAGYSVSPQQLPDGRLYFLCCRCMFEWHVAKKRDVIDGTITLAQYYAQNREYEKVRRWGHKTFGTNSGEIPNSVQFNIPRLNAQRARDDADFEVYLQNHKDEARRAAIG